MQTPESPTRLYHYRIATKNGRCGVIAETCATMALLRVMELGEEIADWELVADPAEPIAVAQNELSQTPNPE